MSGRFALESGGTVISHETTYRFIYAQLARAKNYNWRHYLPRAKSKRGWRGRKGGSPHVASTQELPQHPQLVIVLGADTFNARQTPLRHW